MRYFTSNSNFEYLTSQATFHFHSMRKFHKVVNTSRRNTNVTLHRTESHLAANRNFSNLEFQTSCSIFFSPDTAIKDVDWHPEVYLILVGLLCCLKKRRSEKAKKIKVSIIFRINCFCYIKCEGVCLPQGVEMRLVLFLSFCQSDSSNTSTNSIPNYFYHKSKSL